MVMADEDRFERKVMEDSMSLSEALAEAHGYD